MRKCRFMTFCNRLIPIFVGISTILDNIFTDSEVMIMKKFNFYKVVHLTIMVIMTAISLYLLLQSGVREYIFSEKPATILFFVVWVILIANFIFLFIDFNMISEIKLSYHSLYEVAYSDSLASIPNRYSCDTLIDKYADISLPEHVGCLMMSISDLMEVNKQFGRKSGNHLLREFSNILTNCAGSKCFVGRNGGNKFLAVFENSTPDEMDAFLQAVESRVLQFNRANPLQIKYAVGRAANCEEGLDQITRLIALSDNRLNEQLKGNK